MMDSVTVSVPARLHLGFLDLNGGLGRKFGSLGVALSEPITRLTAHRAGSTQIEGPESERAGLAWERLRRDLAVTDEFALHIDRAIPAHAGLGSGTQIALAVAAALRALTGLPPDPRTDAARLNRGARSGIGIGLFESGGVVLDAGRGGDGRLPPVIARHDFPEEWRVLLILDDECEGVHGAKEIEAFAALPPFPETEAAHICRLVLMQIMPALIERDLATFGAGIAEMQHRLGDHFAAAQGGRYTSPRVARCAAALEEAGAHGCGQSSWGPTGFGFAASEQEAHRLQSALGQGSALSGVAVKIVKGNNTGATIAPGGRNHG